MTANDNRINISKEPWLAVAVSALWGGTGQIYSGRMRRGCFLICVEVMLLLLAWWFALSPTGNVGMAFGLFLLLPIVRTWNLFDAHKCARTTNREDFKISRKENKDPWLAVFLSYLIPGLGQLYIRKWFWGSIFVGCFVALRLAGRTNPLAFVGLSALLSVLVCYHAYICSPVHREASAKPILIVSAGILCAGLCLRADLLVRQYAVEPFIIPAAPQYYPKEFQKTAMEPTLEGDDRILVRKAGKYIPKRGDIIVFRSPEDPAIPYVKRVVAFQGESVEIKNGHVYINGDILKVSPFRKIGYVSEGDLGTEGNPYIVASNSFFVLGDNSGNSLDSRHFGPIPQADLVGRAYKIYWPLHRIGPIE
jgi:signal peptidase I